MKVIASWRLELNTDCPHCNAYIDLMYSHDISEALGDIQPCESRNDEEIEVYCPKCKKEFTVTDLEY